MPKYVVYTMNTNDEIIDGPDIFEDETLARRHGERLQRSADSCEEDDIVEIWTVTKIEQFKYPETANKIWLEKDG